MSYWVALQQDGQNVYVDGHSEGGTYALGGTTDADLNVTYNYGEVYCLFGWSVKELHEQLAEATIPKLTELAEKLPDRPYKADYWAPTPGNAGHVVHILLRWAKQHPMAKWHVS